MPTILITGSNRGLGLELVKQFLADNWRVFACCRSIKNSPELTDLKNNNSNTLEIFEANVSDLADIQKLSEKLKNEKIDILFNNAAKYGSEREDMDAIDPALWLEVFNINTLSPFYMANAFKNNISASERKIIVNMSSLMGSIADNSSGKAYIYRSSKAALNAVTKSLSIDLKEKGITTICMHPGWVQTDMGGENAPLQPEDSVKGIKKVLLNLRSKDNGKFYDYQGKTLPW